MRVTFFSSRSAGAYLHVYRAIQRVCPNFSPSYFTCDYESGMSRPVAMVFSCTLWGCIFHFQQAIFAYMHDDLHFPPHLLSLISEQTGRLAFARTLLEFELQLTVLRIMLGVKLTVTEMCQYCKARLWFPLNLQLIFHDFAPVIAQFAMYFHDNWVSGAVALPVVWAFFGRARALRKSFRPPPLPTYRALPSESS